MADVTIRGASPFKRMMWWVMTFCTCGLWALFVGKPKK